MSARRLGLRPPGFPPDLTELPGAQGCDHNDAVVYCWRPWSGFSIARACLSCGQLVRQPGHWWSRRNMTEASHALQRVLAAEQAERIAALYASSR
jgi:hypothetical protein